MNSHPGPVAGNMSTQDRPPRCPGSMPSIGRPTVSSACRSCFPLLLALFSGCGSVHPEADFQHAAQLVTVRTGFDNVYSPDDETGIQSQLSSWLEDGITSDEAVHIALLNNRAFQSRFQDIGVSRAELVQSALFTNPSLSFSARALDQGGRTNLSFSVAQELVDLWQIPVRKRIARDKLESAVLGVTAAGIDLAAQAEGAYVHLRVQQELEGLARENLGLLQQTLEMTQRRFDAGETTILDVNLIQSSVLDGKIKVASAHRDTTLARATLADALGLSVEQGDIEAIDPLPNTDLDSGDEAVLIRQALENRLDVQIAARDLDAAAQEVMGQKRAALPSIVLGLEGERPDVATTSPQRSLGDQIATLDTLASSPSQALRDRIVNHIDQARQHKQDKADTVDLLLGPSLQMTLPLFDQNRAQVAKARFLYAQKQKDYEQQLLTVTREVLEARANLSAATEQLRIVRDEALPLARQNIETARHVYEAGEESILVLMVAQQTCNSQREAEVNLSGECAMSRLSLERAVGGRLSPTPPVPDPAP